MISRIGVVAMYVRDQEEALEFYRDKMGFEVRADMGDGSGRFLAVAPPGAETALVLTSVDVHGSELADRFRAEIGFSPHLMLLADDLPATCRTLRERGVKVTDPSPGPGGFPMAQVTDLYGNVISLVDRKDLSVLGPNRDTGRGSSA